MTVAELVRAALVTPDAAAALADLLDERGDYRGKWLRIRWRRFRTEYHRAENRVRNSDLFRWLFGRAMTTSEMGTLIVRDRDDAVRSFQRYVRERFREELAGETVA